MRAASIVMSHPLTKNSPKMRCIEWDDIVQAFATDRPNQPFAMGIGRRHSNRRPQNVDTPALYRLVQTGRERLVSIMQEEFIIAIAGKRFAELLKSPVCRRMSGDIEMNQTSGPDLRSNEYIKDAEVCRDGNEEITRNDFASMVPEKR